MFKHSLRDDASPDLTNPPDGIGARMPSTLLRRLATSYPPRVPGPPNLGMCLNSTQISSPSSGRAFEARFSYTHLPNQDVTLPSSDAPRSPGGVSPLCRGPWRDRGALRGTSSSF
ncbi:hypothetical protein PCANC_08033 [Puccinia coronata f. sp. avenae]|uniref:Uncharacterized protein n=1 Tax=Puccinia coronata f. sp. avenae TaxID=200324 RepID=A0A2N5VJ62_9BASI|nr:hypothetical protein PCANC_08033 [Puccinia coronata f. sp. avenae]PLW50031.1 hypothetical protein PCASD_01270 [Puccinia coronata f. sp. avenae]